MRLSLQQAVDRYGEIKNGAWADEGKWMEYYTVPPAVEEHWRNGCLDGSPPTTRIRINKDIHAALDQALKSVIDRTLLSELRTFDGCQNIRCVRGRTSISTHSYGLAIDLDADDNCMGTKGDLSPEFVNCWTDAGWDWGGNFHGRTDPMHFSYAWE